MNEKAMQFGEVVAWSVRDYVSRAKLSDALKKENIGICVKRTDKRTYLKRALNECIGNGVLREIGEDDKKIAYAIVEEDTDVSTASWLGSMREAVVMDKETGEISVRNEGKKSPFLDSILRAMGRNEGGLIAAEIGMTIRRVIERYCDAVSLRDTGGVYFIPAKNSGILDKLCNALQEVESRRGAIRLRRFSVARTNNSEESIQELVALTVSTTARRVQNEANDLLADLKTRPSSFKTRIKTLASAADSLRAYEALLNKSLEDVHGQIEATRVHVEKRLKQCIRRRSIMRLKKKN